MSFKIGTKLIICFLLISLTPLAVATYISYGSSKNAVEEEARQKLSAVAENESNQIRSYLREKEKDITQLSFMPNLKDALQRYKGAYSGQGMNSVEYNAVDHEYRPFLAYYQRAYGYDELLLVSPAGEVVFSVKERKYPKLRYKIAPGQDAELADVFLRTTKSASLQTEISNFVYDAEENKAVVFIGIPVRSGGSYAGTLVAGMDTSGISDLVRDYAGLGKTGETIVVARMGNEAVILTPLRFKPEVSYKRSIELGSDQEPAIQNAVSGKNGSDISVDYRNKKALSIWSYLPKFRLGIVVKMDTSEVFAKAERLKNVLFITGTVLLAIVVVVAILIAHTISGPIKDLTTVSRVITNGDLEKRAEVETEDEIGVLADSFNQMTDSLVEAKSRVEEQKAQLEEQKKLLEKANKELDGFVYTASHDLRAPLRAISSFSNFLEEDYKKKLGKEGSGYVSEIRKGSDRMNDLITDLLSLSRIARIKNPYEEVNMNELVRSVIERIKFDIEKNKVDLNVQNKMPVVRCDRIKMSEVFLNLINNAIKFSSKNNAAAPKVEVGYADKSDRHEFYVKDNGIGVDPKFKNEIFGIFRRLETASGYEGTGAGLAIVKRVIDDHKGSIWVDSELGKGATFHFTIPKVKEKAWQGKS